MFGNNRKISGRQMTAMLVLQLLGLQLLIGQVLLKLCGMWSFFCLLLGAAVGVFAIFRTSRMDRWKRGTRWLYAGIIVGLSGYLFAQMVKVLQIVFLPEIPGGILIAMTGFLIWYAIRRGVEARARIYEVSFWFCVLFLCLVFVVWYVLLFRFESGAFLLERLRENVSDGITDQGQGNRLYRIVLGCLLSVLGYLPVLQCAWWNSKKQVARSDRGRLAAAVGGVTALGFGYVLLLRLVYGAANLSSMQFGYLQLISDSAFLKRVLVFAAGAWLTMLFLFLVSVAGTFSDEKESQNKNSRAAWKKRLALTGLVVFAGACCYKYEWSQTDWSVQTGVRSQTIWGGQYDSHEIENQLYPLAVGIDTQDGKWLITYCFLEEEEAGGGEEDTPLEEKIVTLQADTWEDAAQKLKEMRLGTLRDTHVQAVVLGSHLLEEQERLELLQKQWLSLRIRIGSAACFQAEDTKESLQSVAEEITTYSGWKKLVAAQRQENGGEKITVACVLSKWQSQEQSWSEEVEIPFLPD